VTHRLLPLLAHAIGAALAQTYSGPTPTKSDLPYLKGANSPAHTPLALPVFLIKTAKFDPKGLSLYRLEAKDGRRQISASTKKSADVIQVLVTRLTPNGVFRMEVTDSLESGEYALILEGTNQGFCFQIE
jgi:hypothetical protein